MISLIKAGWALLALLLTCRGLDLLIEGGLILFAPHRLWPTKAPDDLMARASGSIKPMSVAARLALGIWLLLLAAWLVWWGVL